MDRRRNRESPISITHWIAWLGSTVVAAVAMSAYTFTTFETKQENQVEHESVEKRLDRIETKIDHILEQK